ncbi:hypothetical protein [Arthrobacter sp. UYCu712]|uniref:LGFP repeat-containing protein n=1 Tax=Arthrobacter sp. UYCu712 TaxID=3156340 RepID=UPI0033909FCC
MLVSIAPAAVAVTCAPSTPKPTNTFPGTAVAAANFESGDLKGFKVFTLGNGTVKVSSAFSHSGSCAAFLHATTANNSIANMQAALPAGTTEAYADGWFNIAKDGVAGNNVPYFRFFSGTERVIDLFRDNGSGAVVLRTTAPSGAFSYNTLVPSTKLDAWDHVAMHVVANGTKTGVQVWFNEKSVHASTSAKIGAKSLTAVQLGAEHDTQMGDIYADDVIVKAGSGTPGPIPGPGGGTNTPGPGSGGSGVPAAASADIQRVAAANPDLGQALSPIACGTPGGCRQEYAAGLIVWSSATGAHVNAGGIHVAWTAAGAEKGRLGYPTTDVVCGLRNGGCYQMYQGGAIIWSPNTGSWLSVGAIRAAWGAAGFENGRLGYPLNNEACGLRSGGCVQAYQGGTIVWSAATGPRALFGGIRAVWAGSGSQNGRLGYPSSNETCGLRSGGCYQMFQGGAVIWSPATGALMSVGGIRAAWASTGFENGRFGYPTTNEYVSGGEVVQNYQGGRIIWSPSTGIRFA